MEICNMENSNKHTRRNVLFIVPIFIIGFVFLVFIGFNMTSNVFDEYPVLKNDEAVYETITFVEKYKGTTLIETKSGKTLGLRAFISSNCNNILYDYAVVGDSLVHKPGSRLLYLYKKETGEKIRFELDFLED